MVANPGKAPEQIVKDNPDDYTPQHDLEVIGPLVDQVLAENAQSVVDYQNGKEKAFAFLVGQVMKMTKGKASPQVVNDLLKQKIQNRMPSK